MSAVALISGALFRAPALKTAKSGKPYVVATIKVAADNAIDFWRIAAFSEGARTELLRLEDGDKVSIQGALKLEVYQSKDGEQKLSRSVVADHVLALRQPPRERRAKTAPDRRRAPSTSPARNPVPINDDLPWSAE